MYKKEQFDQIHQQYNELKSFIEDLSLDVASHRGQETGHFGRMASCEVIPVSHDAKKPLLDDYFDGNDGNHYHYDNGRTYADDLKAYEDSIQPAAIRAFFWFSQSDNGDHIEFPFDYISNENWREIESAKMLEKERQKEQEQLRTQKNKEERERSELARLTEKYGPPEVPTALKASL